MEEMLKSGQITLTSSIISNTEWGLNIEIEISQPKEDKPIIFRYTYRIDRVKLQDWLDAHKYLTEGPLLMFMSKGMAFTITTDKPFRSLASIITKYEDDANLGDFSYYKPRIVEEPVTLVVHREVVSNHDWIVKCTIP